MNVELHGLLATVLTFSELIGFASWVKAVAPEVGVSSAHEHRLRPVYRIACVIRQADDEEFPVCAQETARVLIGVAHRPMETLTAARHRWEQQWCSIPAVRSGEAWGYIWESQGIIRLIDQVTESNRSLAKARSTAIQKSRYEVAGEIADFDRAVKRGRTRAAWNMLHPLLGGLPGHGR